MAMEPTAEKPVRNLPQSTHLGKGVAAMMSGQKYGKQARATSSGAFGVLSFPFEVAESPWRTGRIQ